MLIIIGSMDTTAGLRWWRHGCSSRLVRRTV